MSATTRASMTKKNNPYKICEKFLCIKRTTGNRCDCGGMLHDVLTDKGLELKLSKEAGKRKGTPISGSRTAKPKHRENEHGEAVDVVAFTRP